MGGTEALPVDTVSPSWNYFHSIMHAAIQMWMWVNVIKQQLIVAELDFCLVNTDIPEIIPEWNQQSVGSVQVGWFSHALPSIIWNEFQGNYTIVSKVLWRIINKIYTNNTV
jgi:hypothetical protein